MNRVILIGRLVARPELRYTQNGVAVARFTLAVDRPFKNQNKDTDFIDCVVWGAQAENVEQYLDKGRQVAVEGRLQIRAYETQEGQKRRATEIVCDRVEFLGSKPADAPGRPDEALGIDDPLPF